LRRDTQMVKMVNLHKILDAIISKERGMEIKLE
jgi:hypothetical protein